MRSDDEDDRPPICPACGVTMGIVVDDETGESRYACWECGFSEASGGRRSRSSRS